MSKIGDSLHSATNHAIEDMDVSNKEKERADAKKGQIKAEKFGRDAALEIW
jgi:hypothetical protein